jgi:hypothetical protein
MSALLWLVAVIGVLTLIGAIIQVVGIACSYLMILGFAIVSGVKSLVAR